MFDHYINCNLAIYNKKQQQNKLNIETPTKSNAKWRTISLSSQLDKFQWVSLLERKHRAHERCAYVNQAFLYSHSIRKLKRVLSLIHEEDEVEAGPKRRDFI